MDKILKLLALRVKSKSPKLFRLITNSALITGSIAGLTLLLPLGLPAWGVTALTITISICTGLGAAASLTTTDEEIIKQENSKRDKR